jgi:hypothetical protein
MMTKAKIALAAALFFGVAAPAQAAHDDDRQGEGFAFHTGPLGQRLGSSAPFRGFFAYAPHGTYGYAPRHDRRRWRHAY